MQKHVKYSKYSINRDDKYLENETRLNLILLKFYCQMYKTSTACY